MSDFGYDTDECESVAGWSDGSDLSFEWKYKQEDERTVDGVAHDAKEKSETHGAPKKIQIRYRLLPDIPNVPRLPADFIIRCNNCEFLVDRIFISRSSQYFKTACEGGFREGIEGEMDLSEEHPVVVLYLIRHFYGRSYLSEEQDDEKLWNVLPDKERWERHYTINAAVYIAAEKYGIFGLKAEARRAFRKELPWPQVFRENRQGQLRSLIEDLIEAIHFIWSNTIRSDDELRKTVIIGLTGDQDRLVSRMLDRPDFLELIKEFPELAVEILRRALPPACREDQRGLCERGEVEVELELPYQTSPFFPSFPISFASNFISLDSFSL